ncbi:putrescine transport system permease protein PotH [Holospora obtusa F1]|uniref:Putrescine transport system permease protein PotH n=1 Tax=Holospora obtusa F1 TaxID=1399147 RepID=W6TGJ9_HOLOB|nr:ABC transporter permease [Holospora obtusa]ETZ07020.1 putrescine transport system permease protein PotH [Holospora obtusa F1]
MFNQIINIFHYISHKWRSFWVMIPYGWFGMFLIIPISILIIISISEPKIDTPPFTPLLRYTENYGIEIRLFFVNYYRVLSQALYRKAYFTSLYLAFSSTVISLLLGYPMAYVITRFSKPWRVFLLILVALPFLSSFLVRMCAWTNILSTHGFINFILWKYLGIGPFRCIHNQGAVLLGIVYSYLTFMIFPLYITLEKIDATMLEASYTLGCRPWRAFWKIILPLSTPGILAGSSLVFIPAVGEYIIPEILGGKQCITIGRLLWYEFFVNHDWPAACALALVMMSFLLIPIVAFEKLQKKVERSLDT